MRCPAKTLHDLEWSTLLSHLSERCAGEQAAARCLELPFLKERAATRRLALVAELLNCIRDDDAPPSLPALPVDEAIAHVRGQGFVPPDALRAVATNLKLFVGLVRYLDNRADVCPLNGPEVLPDRNRVNPMALARLAGEIESTFEADGTISDSASPLLGKLRRRVESYRKAILNRMDEIGEERADVLRDKTVTMRNDRYVLPVRTDAHRPLKGIVHGSSGTGNTMFIEPEQVVGLGNDLMLAREDVLREEARILAALRDAVLDQLDEARYACEAIVDADMRIAAARLSFELDAAVPKVGAPGEINLRRARHPLLLLDGVDVIPSNIETVSGGCLLISGPNAGGKTVLLKTMGICALMLAAGLPVPVDPESVLGPPPSVLTDIGDDQSLALNLSTFSAHMKNIGAIFEDAERGSLVLLDELCAGTDPVEGTALAESILDKLVRYGANVMATTHFDALKTAAHEKEEFLNAAMGFDASSGKPTFEICLGVPGSSSALEVASAYGIPASVVERARDRLPEGARALSNAVAALEKERVEMSRERLALTQQRNTLLEAERKHTSELAALKRKQDKFVEKETEALWSEIRKARERIRDVEKSVRRRGADGATVKRARARVNEVATALDPGGALSSERREDLPGRPAEPKDVVPGARVFVTSLGKEATVDAPLKGNTVSVMAGPLRMRLNLEELNLLPAAGGKKQGKPQRPKTPARDDGGAREAIRTSDNTLDLRGKTVDEAVDAVDFFLDQALKSGLDAIFVLHGHGTGALRDAVRCYMSESRYVSEHRPGDREEGGDGVTLAWLR